jgi:hypothetical protein
MMSGPITPYAGASADRLTAIVNATNAGQMLNGQAFAPLQPTDNFTYGQPMAYVDSTGRNTEVAVVFNEPNYQKTDYVQYTRQPLTILDSLPAGYLDTVVIPAVPFRLSQILPLINAALGLDLDVSEIRDQQYTTIQSSYALPINAAVSLAWIDSDFTFQASVALSQTVNAMNEPRLIYTPPTPT